MANIGKVRLEGLGSNAYDFGCLYNALIDAGWPAGHAADYAAKVTSNGLQVECKCV